MSVVRVFAVTALAVLAACQSSSSRVSPEKHPEYLKIEPEIDRLVKAVRTMEDAELYGALQELLAYDVFAVNRVATLLDEPNPRLRSNALWVLSQISDRNYPEVMEDIDGYLVDHLDDPDRLVRYEAAAGLVTRNHWEHIPVLFDGMEDQSAAVRFSCHATLQDVTAQGFGYSVDAEPELRVRAVDRWRGWYSDWQAHSQG